MDNKLSDCTLCPRNCHADRLSGQTGYCGQTAVITAARSSLHMWEEPCLSGRAGSGTVFFSGCSLNCLFCQNAEISHNGSGKAVSAQRLSKIFLELQEKGANNINLVTPTHFVPQIAKALIAAKAAGLVLPVVYNSSGYEKVETLRLLEGLVDIYLPDLKYLSSTLSGEYSFAEDYFQYAAPAIGEMVRQAGSPAFAPQPPASSSEGDDYDGPLMTRGVIVRHLALPGCADDSKAVIRYLHQTYGSQIYISLMNQYTPMPRVAGHPLLGRRLTRREYDELVDYAISLGVENGFIQGGDTASESFIPPFDFEGI